MSERDRLDRLTRKAEEQVPPFTPEDVTRIRQLHAAHFGDGYYDYNDLADRIEALLPPEDT